MYAKVCKENSEYAYTSESDKSSNDSEDYSIVDEEPLISPQVFSTEETNMKIDTISSKMIDKKAIATLQAKEKGLIEAICNMDKEIEYVKPENLAVIIDEGNKRVILPETLRLTVFNLIHDRLHLGIDKTIEAISKDYYWPTLKKDVTDWVQSCVVCQATKVTRHNRPKIGFFPDNTERFQFVHIDLVSPLNEASCNNKFILTAKDRATVFL